jgi:hypothetical protein
MKTVEYPPTQYGIWQVFGQNETNRYSLGFYEGCYQHIYDYSYTLNFGYEPLIELIEPIKINPDFMAEFKKLQQEKKDLEEKLSKLDKKLKKLPW